MKVLVHYRKDPDLDEVCDAVPARRDAGPKGSLYVTGEHFGTTMYPDQHGPSSEYSVWYEVVEE